MVNVVLFGNNTNCYTIFQHFVYRQDIILI